MNRKFVRIVVCLAFALSAVAVAANSTASLKAGKADLKSASVLAFGPDAVLFVGDSMGASIWALDTGDRTANSAAKPVDIKGINAKIAALLGTAPDQILVQDVAVNPISKRVYLAVSRGRGPDAQPVLLRTDASGKLEEFALDNVKHSRVELPNAPDPSAKDRRGQPVRQEAISDLAYVDGRVFIAGLSNEEFASNLRSVPFPFAEANRGTSVEIYHGQHGRFETNSPVRTFVPYHVKNEPHILAAYTCTPLVKFPVSSLKPGAKVTGTTIAELGNRNRPLDMIVYKKGGSDYILMNNSSRGVMKMSTNGIEAIQPIVSQTEKAGLPFETLAELKDVQQLDRYDRDHAIILVGTEAGSLDLKSIALP